jgi:hypothetical protein
MRFAEFKKLFAGNEDLYAEYMVLLVDLDTVPSDGVDVVISPVRAVQVVPEAGEIRLVSAAAQPEASPLPVALFENFAGSWPMDGVHDVDFIVKVQCPIAPEESPAQVPELLPLAGVWIGRMSGEIWLLVRPESEYPGDLLPS